MEEKQREEITQKLNEQLPEIEISQDAINNLINMIRGRQVMLDSDLAMLYQVETKVFNQAINRNIERFPERFRFQLTREEYASLRSQIVTSKGKGGRRYMPYAFTEQGISMLSAVLRSDIAIQISIKIMDAFVEMRRFLTSNALMFARINEMEMKQVIFQEHTEEKFDKIFRYIAEHQESSQKIFFDGQIYDAFSLLVDLVRKAESKLVLVDNYVDVDTLNILAKKKAGIEVVIYTARGNKLTETDIKNFNKQYPTLEVRNTGMFHERFLIIDNTYAYHIGASIKDAGKKCFGVSLIEDNKIVRDILERLKLEAEELMSENDV
ncbi:MAG: ORF6N domain-containing protein [Lachnospiraceae bacterium]|nr:ORF6N domain-containing protein [Lachnospiraceae bacterium]